MNYTERRSVSRCGKCILPPSSLTRSLHFDPEDGGSFYPRKPEILRAFTEYRLCRAELALFVFDVLTAGGAGALIISLHVSPR
jgi:hypothetical protein